MRVAPARDDETRTLQPINTVLGLQPEGATPPHISHDQHVQQHLLWLKEHDPEQFALYLEAALSDDPVAAQRMFQLTELRINGASA